MNLKTLLKLCGHEVPEKKLTGLSRKSSIGYYGGKAEGFNNALSILDLEIDMSKVVDKVKLHNCICGNVPHSIDDCEEADKMVEHITSSMNDICGGGK